MSYSDVFICVWGAYDVYKEKKTVLFISPIILLWYPYGTSHFLGKINFDNEKFLLIREKEHTMAYFAFNHPDLGLLLVCYFGDVSLL